MTVTSTLVSSNVQNKIKDSSCFVPGSCALSLHFGELQERNRQQLQGRQIAATVTPAMPSVSTACQDGSAGGLPTSHPCYPPAGVTGCWRQAGRQLPVRQHDRKEGMVVAVAGSVGGTGMRQHWLERQETASSA